MRTELTKKEEDTWAFILGFEVDNGFTPMLLEIMDKLKISKSLAQYYVNQLEKKGWIAKVETSRNIRIIEHEN